jgi:hypothetical protein
MEHCPNCRARWDGAETCRRCGMDLLSLLSAERAVERLLRRAVAQLVAGEAAAARDTLAKARALSPDPIIGHLRGFSLSLSARPRQTEDAGGPAMTRRE